MENIEDLKKEIKKLKRKNLMLEQSLNQDKNLRDKYTSTLEKLKKQDEELEKINYTLQEKIDEKTKELKETIDRYDFAIKGSSDGLWDWHIKTKEIYFSDMWKRMLGYSDRELDNSFTVWCDLIYEKDYTRFREDINDSLEGKNKSFEHKYRLKHKDGSLIWVSNKGRTFFNEKDEPIRMSGFHTNITNIKNKEKELKEKEALLSEKSKMAVMGEMLENIAHQWRQPLSTISTAATGMSLEKEAGILSDKEFFNNLEVINDATQYLSKTIDDFRDFFISDKEKVLFETDFIIDKTLKLLHFDFDMINIIKDIKNIRIFGSEVLLVQVLMNLLSNSRDELKKMEDKEKLIFINSYEEQNYCYLEVIDNAGGIPQNILSKMFEPFFTTKEKSKRTGLGLHMCRNFVEKQFKGSIEIKNCIYEYENRKYQGAKVSIKIPLNHKE